MTLMSFLESLNELETDVHVDQLQIAHIDSMHSDETAQDVIDLAREHGLEADEVAGLIVIEP